MCFFKKFWNLFCDVKDKRSMWIIIMWNRVVKPWRHIVMAPECLVLNKGALHGILLGFGYEKSLFGAVVLVWKEILGFWATGRVPRQFSCVPGYFLLRNISEIPVPRLYTAQPFVEVNFGDYKLTDMIQCFAPDCKYQSESHTCRFYAFPNKDQKTNGWAVYSRWYFTVRNTQERN